MKDYSERKLLMGFTCAALTDRKLTVSSAMKTAPSAASANIHHSILTRYANSRDQMSIAHQATGLAIRIATQTSTMNSPDNNLNKNLNKAMPGFKLFSFKHLPF
jgi:hypothetical protein